MFALNGSDPQTQWLTITNVLLGIVVAISLIVMTGGIVQEIVSRIRRRRRFAAEIDRDMRRLSDMRTFEVPGLGITMADGGERKPGPHDRHKH